MGLGQEEQELGEESKFAGVWGASQRLVAEEVRDERLVASSLLLGGTPGPG